MIVSKVDLEFDQWLHGRACEHEDGVLLHHDPGNLATIAALRTELERTSSEFPMIVSKVIYSGTHCGDALSLADIALLQLEIVTLAAYRGSTPELDALVRAFAQQLAELAELAECALRIGKPIAF